MPCYTSKLRTLLFSSLIFLPSLPLIAETDTERAFSKIYRDRVWGKDHLGRGTSGPGSTLEECGPYLNYLHNLLNTFEIDSIVELGCGDWVIGSHINLDDRNYLGIDVVEEIITRNQTQFSASNIQFLQSDGSENELPSADLFICKDVLQHLPLCQIFAILSQMNKYKYVLLVNDILDSDPTTNTDIQAGSYRPLNLSYEPFYLRPDHIYNYISGYVTKQIFLMKPGHSNPG